ncbi:hypothetical protein, partial [Noviherbaspirillum denitrificans]|uniref:hypothetical protein n=1 Tax=Noviherbaspirillum denitrificans TaxID=1968433 RepID=UPI0019811465
GICAIGVRTPEIMQIIGFTSSAQDPAISIRATPAKALPKPMTAEEFAELSKTDPNIYQKFINSQQRNIERGEVDKLMNFLARGKFE